MRIGIASAFSCGVGLWKRLQDEGHEVKVWRGTLKDDSPDLLVSHRYVGEGIVPLIDSWHRLLQWCKEAPSIMLFDSSGLGRMADAARHAGVLVVGGGSFCDNLEKNRSYGRKIAQLAGIESPPYEEFSSIDDCIAYARAHPKLAPAYWKTNAYIDGDSTHPCENAGEVIEYLTWVKTRARNTISCVLERKLDGFALSTHRWWNGRAWIGPYMWTLEHKAFGAKDIGPSTGCALNAVGYYEDDEPLIAKALNWEKLTPSFTRAQAPPGLYDINAIVQDGKAFFLEWTPRFGWDSEGTSHLLYPNFSAWLHFVASGADPAPEPTRSDFAVAVRITVAPAPWEHGERDEKGSPVGMYVRGDVGDLWSEGFVGYELSNRGDEGLAVAAPEGLVGLATAVGDIASVAAEDALEHAGRIRTGMKPSYRPDLGDAILEDAQKCVSNGFDDLPPGLLE